MNRLLVLLSVLVLSGCAVNPVTGRNELSLVTEAQERAIGNQQYGPSRQSQGGEFLVDRQLSAYVNEVGQRLAAVSDRQLDYEFVVLNNSVPNAWALPGGKIAVNRGLLLELNSEAELAAVLGHEIVHAAARHGAQAMTRGTLLQGALAVGAFATRDNEFSDYILGASQLGAQLISQRYGRDAERESDYYGIQYMVRAGYDPNAAVSLQQTFVRLSEGRSQGWIDGLFASHPPSIERVNNNQALVDELMPALEGRDLVTGEEPYRQSIAYLLETREAYEYFDEAEKAINDDDLEIAMGNLEEAIRLVPDEARFHGLKGDILVYQRRYREAIASYDKALGLDDNYFDYYLGRGVAKSRLNQTTEARRDLERSSQLLPTAIAANELGKLSLAAGSRDEAKSWFAQAAQARGQVGEEARTAFTRLDIADNPASYVDVQVYADANGRIYARVFNRSSVPLNEVRVDFAAIVDGGISRRSATARSLPGNSTTDVSSGLVFSDTSTWTQDMMSAQISSISL